MDQPVPVFSLPEKAFDARSVPVSALINSQAVQSSRPTGLYFSRRSMKQVRHTVLIIRIRQNSSVNLNSLNGRMTAIVACVLSFLQTSPRKLRHASNGGMLLQRIEPAFFLHTKNEVFNHRKFVWGADIPY
jgi:hypothetical protein